MFTPDRKWHAVIVVFALFWGSVLTADLAAGAVHLTAVDGDNGDYFGSSTTELEDINSDGRWEFLVGAPFDQTAGLDAGAVLLWFGREQLTVAADRVWSGVSPERFGYAVARIGDVNHDGKADWAVGAPGSNANGAASGRVYVFYGRTSPLASADLVIDGASGGDQFGHAISAAGDFDGDGYDDFIVGAPYSDLRALEAGAAYVIYGAAGGPSTSLAQATVFTGQIFEDHFGWSVSDAGNFLGGTEACVAVGAPLSNIYGGLDGGALYVYKGKLGGAAPDTTIDFAAGTKAVSKAYSQFGFAVRGVGSWNGDGFTDLAVGAPYCNEGGQQAGRVEIFLGGSSTPRQADYYVNGASGYDNFGYSLARLHDVSGTSADDVLVGAPFQDDSATDAGRAYLYEGNRTTATLASNLIVLVTVPLPSNSAADDLFGYAVASAGDFDGDGRWDYAVGAPGGNNLSGSTGGYCYLVDSNGLVVANTLSRWDAVRGLDGGISLSFDFGLPADPVATVALRRVDRDEAGRETGRRTLWDGPALPAGSCPEGGCLVRASGGYLYVDVTTSGSISTCDLFVSSATGGVDPLTGLRGRNLRPRPRAPTGPAFRSGLAEPRQPPWWSASGPPSLPRSRSGRGSARTAVRELSPGPVPAIGRSSSGTVATTPATPRPRGRISCGSRPRGDP